MNTKNIVKFNSAEEFNDASKKRREKFVETHERSRWREPGVSIGGAWMSLSDYNGFSVVLLCSSLTGGDVLFAVETEESHNVLDDEIARADADGLDLQYGGWNLAVAYIAAGNELARRAGLVPTERDYDW